MKRRESRESAPKHAPPPALQRNNPLHGVRLDVMLEQMVDRYGWDGLARDIPINCFRVDPSMTSALKYLRKSPRARKKVEEIYARFVAGRTG